jgi:NAD(P)-dependent dehydrogenase (short-subunit alcohol dehydrogenase family)
MTVRRKAGGAWTRGTKNPSRRRPEGTRHKQVPDSRDLQEQQNDLALQERFLREVPTTRLGRPSDLAAVVAFLLSDDAEWINGQVLSVDGGATLRP